MVNTLRSRLLHAALVPVVVVVVTLITVFLNVRLDDLKSAHQQRGELLLRQLALGSEYGVFSGNQASLQAVALEIRKHPDVRGVAVFDASGALLATAGAYGIQGAAGSVVVDLHGSYSGVVGLPVYETAQLLQRCGIAVP